ncbi:MAG: hypothetical protein ACSHYA_11945 [Opitutaceae bacterium]
MKQKTCICSLLSLSGALLVSGLSVSAVTLSLPDLSIPDGDATETVVTMPAGADFVRVTGDWSSSSGAALSDELELTIVGPGEITGFLSVFDNAASNSALVSGLTGIVELTSTGTLGDYEFSLTNLTEGSEVAFQNGSIELLTLVEEFVDNGSITSGSPTFDRPDENGAASGRNTRYNTYSFTPTATGTYSIESQQVAFDGFIAIYAGDQDTAPFSGFLAANDDSSAGESFSQLEVDLDSGQTYTLVTTSYSTLASGSFTNRIRSFSPLVINDEKATTFSDFAEQRGFVGGLDADDSGNGLANLLEYALGRDADSPNAAPLETLFRDGRLVGRFYRDPDLTDIAYILEASSDLTETGVWEELYNSEVDLQPNADGDYQEIEDSELLSGFRFLRLRVAYLGTSATTYEDYAAQQGIGAPEADDNGNGLLNLLEYALGRDADTPYAAPLETFFRDGRLVGRFYRDPELMDIAYILEATNDLSDTGNWEELYDSSVDLQPNADGEFQEIEDSQLLSGFRFLRLRVVYLDSDSYSSYAADQGIGAPEADDNANGIPNLLEYALGRESDTPYAAPLETLFSDGRLVGRFYRDPELTDISYVLEATSDLAAVEGWEVLYDSEVDLQANADGDYQEVDDSELLSGLRFFRLRVRQND